jgi:hypothetical protein
VRIISIIFAVSAASTGFKAAWLWLKSGRVPIDPGWPANMPAPTEFEAEQGGWLNGALRAIEEAAEWNRKAARWTACSVALAALAAILGAGLSRSQRQPSPNSSQKSGVMEKKPSFRPSCTRSVQARPSGRRPIRLLTVPASGFAAVSAPAPIRGLTPDRSRIRPKSRPARQRHPSTRAVGAGAPPRLAPLSPRGRGAGLSAP